MPRQRNAPLAAQLRQRSQRKAKNPREEAKPDTGASESDKAPALATNKLAPYTPSDSLARRCLIAVRIASALYNPISDCDEVFNFWEASHYLQYGWGLQTWEWAPQYAIRSWSFVSVPAVVGWLISLVTSNKLQVFFFLRMVFGTLCATCETKFYRAIVNEVNPHIGRYVLFGLAASAGMFSASTAFLPSTLAMYTTMLAFSESLGYPTDANKKRVYKVLGWIGLGALLGWPFAAAVGIPFVIEELTIRGQATSSYEGKSWVLRRLFRIAEATFSLTVVILTLIVAIDSKFYRQIQVVPWNLVRYNVFGGADRGPDIYGTEPWWFYMLNGALNFNFLWPLALASYLCIAITMVVDRTRLGVQSDKRNLSPSLLLAFKLTPFYLWLLIFTIQPHKEERFLFVVYPLIIFNAAVSLYLIRGWFQIVLRKFGVKLESQKEAASTFTFLFVILTILLHVSRIRAQIKNYGAPLRVYTHLWTHPEDYGLNLNYNTTRHIVMEKPFNFCVGKEWYRYPSSYLLPNSMRLKFVKSDFEGQLPAEFKEDFTTDIEEEKEWITQGKMQVEKTVSVKMKRVRAWTWDGAAESPAEMNDLNKEVPARYIDVEDCDYMVDVDFPERFAHGEAMSANEPRYIQDTKHWEAVFCLPFLDAASTPRLSRAFAIPGVRGQKWGDYCILRRRR